MGINENEYKNGDGQNIDENGSCRRGWWQRQRQRGEGEYGYR